MVVAWKTRELGGYYLENQETRLLSSKVVIAWNSRKLGYCLETRGISWKTRKLGCLENQEKRAIVWNNR